LAWDRVDIATHEVFVYGRDWSRGKTSTTYLPVKSNELQIDKIIWRVEALEHAMMEALSANRLDFVELLIEHGLNMQTFLTPKRLEELYSLVRTIISF